MNIKFFGECDMSSGWFHQKIEKFFQHWDERIQEPDLKTILELYNIKKYIDSGMRLAQWTDAQFLTYQEKSKTIPQILGRYCSTISNENLQELCQAVDRDYIDDFWQLICDYKVYQRINSKVLGNLMDTKENMLWYILRHSILVKFFGRVITDHLVWNPHTAEELLAHFLAAHDCKKHQLYFPVEFTSVMREKILMDYVERDDANVNYLQLLEDAQSVKEFTVSDRLKLKARRKKEAIQEKLFAKKSGFFYGIEVGFESIPDGSIKETHDENKNILSYAYSKEWIEENQDYPTLLNNFIYLFQYVDRCFRCTFVSLRSELSVFERTLGIKGKNEYRTGARFGLKHMRSQGQMIAYRRELQHLNIQLEDIFKWFFEVYLKEEFGANGFTYNPPSAGTTYGEKCKLLASAIDGVLKQYRLFCEEGYVDRELLELSSGHIVFGQLTGIMTNKYAYSSSKDLQNEMFLLFSDQSMMCYTEKTKSQYSTLPQLLVSEDINREDFHHYHQNQLDWLIKRGTIQIADDGRLRINIDRAFVLMDLFYNEVICPFYYEETLQKQVEELVATGDIQYESTLFSRSEQDYLNYVLNKSVFSNGLDLRNKYIHDTCPLSEEKQIQDYVELLKIMILILIKIDEEFEHVSKFRTKKRDFKK